MHRTDPIAAVSGAMETTKVLWLIYYSPVQRTLSISLFSFPSFLPRHGVPCRICSAVGASARVCENPKPPHLTYLPISLPSCRIINNMHHPGAPISWDPAKVLQMVNSACDKRTCPAITQQKHRCTIPGTPPRSSRPRSTSTRCRSWNCLMFSATTSCCNGWPTRSSASGSTSRPRHEGVCCWQLEKVDQGLVSRAGPTDEPFRTRGCSECRP